MGTGIIFALATLAFLAVYIAVVSIVVRYSTRRDVISPDETPARNRSEQRVTDRERIVIRPARIRFEEAQSIY